MSYQAEVGRQSPQTIVERGREYLSRFLLWQVRRVFISLAILVTPSKPGFKREITLEDHRTFPDELVLDSGDKLFITGWLETYIATGTHSDDEPIPETV